MKIRKIDDGGKKRMIKTTMEDGTIFGFDECENSALPATLIFQGAFGEAF